MDKVELDLVPDDSRHLLAEIRQLIEDTRRQTALIVNAGLTSFIGG